MELISLQTSDIKTFRITALPSNAGTSPLGLSANKFYYTLIKLYGDFPNEYKARKKDLLYKSESMRSTCLEGMVQMAVRLLFLAKICGKEINMDIVLYYLDSIETAIRNAERLYKENQTNLIACAQHLSSEKGILVSFVDFCLLSCRQIVCCINKYEVGPGALDMYHIIYDILEHGVNFACNQSEASDYLKHGWSLYECFQKNHCHVSSKIFECMMCIVERISRRMHISVLEGEKILALIAEHRVDISARTFNLWASLLKHCLARSSGNSLQPLRDPLFLQRMHALATASAQDERINGGNSIKVIDYKEYVTLLHQYSEKVQLDLAMKEQGMEEQDMVFTLPCSRSFKAKSSQ
eukprot:113737-Hanusia_phi.AAC.1